MTKQSRFAVEVLIFTAALAIPFRGQMASGGQNSDMQIVFGWAGLFALLRRCREKAQRRKKDRKERNPARIDVTRQLRATSRLSFTASDIFSAG